MMRRLRIFLLVPVLIGFLVGPAWALPLYRVGAPMPTLPSGEILVQTTPDACEGGSIVVIRYYQRPDTNTPGMADYAIVSYGGRVWIFADNVVTTDGVLYGDAKGQGLITDVSTTQDDPVFGDDPCVYITGNENQ